MTAPVLGIDIAKLKFNVCLINPSGKLKHRVFLNTALGFEQLLDWLSRQGVQRVHACLEATGTYGEALSLCLHQAGHSVSVVNPAAIKAFAGSRLSRTKTDRVDAELIARFCLAQAPPAWTPLPQEVRELQALVRRLESLVEMRVAEENRLSSGITVDSVRESVKEHLSYLNEQIKRTEELIRNQLTSHPTLKQQSELLDSIPGIAATTAAHLLAEMKTSSNTGARAKLLLMRGSCPANVVVAVRFVGGRGCRSSAMRGCVVLSTSRPSPRCGVVPSFKRGQQGCAKEVSAR
jgi:transposase